MWFWVTPAHHNILNLTIWKEQLYVFHVVHGCQMSSVNGLLFYIYL
jgi:hypothetical protein